MSNAGCAMMSLVVPAGHEANPGLHEEDEEDEEGGRRSEVEVLFLLACLHLLLTLHVNCLLKQ